MMICFMGQTRIGRKIIQLFIYFYERSVSILNTTSPKINRLHKIRQINSQRFYQMGTIIEMISYLPPIIGLGAFKLITTNSIHNRYSPKIILG